MQMQTVSQLCLSLRFYIDMKLGGTREGFVRGGGVRDGKGVDRVYRDI